MKSKLLIATVAALVGLAVPAAHADAPLAVSATCAAIVITSPETGSTLLGVDGEPPLAVEAGTTLSYPFLQQADSHHWTVYVIADGPWTGDPEFVSGDVAGCAVPEVVETASTYVETVSVWAGIELAPPW